MSFNKKFIRLSSTKVSFLHFFSCFNAISHSELLELSFNSNTPCLCSNSLLNDKLNNLRIPCFDMLSKLDNMQTTKLSGIDVNSKIPSLINFNYYSIHDFHNNPDICQSISNKDSFSALHLNIRSLSANFDCFSQLLHDLHPIILV
jgi:hypothetical protein